MKKNFFNKLIFLIFISCMFFSNCSFSGDDDNTVLKAAVLLSMNNNAVSPDKVRVNLNFETPRGGTILSTQELRDLIFSGAREGGGICNVTGSTKNELCSKEIWLQTGSWSFELEGTIDGVTFKDSVSMNISQINTTIEFNLRPYDGNEAISKGGLYFVLNFSGDADYALLNIKDAVTGTVIETDKKIKGFDVVKKIEYSKTFKGQDSEGLTPGTYKLTVDFYRNDMNTDEPPLNTWEAYARIKAGLTARKEISDFDLTDSYRITYHVPSGATISAAGVVVLCYSRKSDTITLPVYTNADFKVLSWYETENFNISQPGVTSFNPKTKLKNMDFYPLWDTDTGYVTAGGTGNGLSAESAASSAATALTNLKKLHEYGSEQTNLKIQIDGEVSGNTTIGTDYNYVDSITLKGKTGNSTDSLKGSGSNSVLKLECEKSVTITNLKITGGSGVTNGGGIYVGGKSSVILEDGALIDGNSAVQRGGGIYVSANTGTEGRISLTINDGAKITGNKIVNDGTGEYGGMGIFAESAKIVMNGGEISQNNGQRINQRGAVRLHDHCVFDLNGGKITNNSVMHIGGNIFCRASTINMTAGEISEGKAGNESQHGAGGGLWIEKESPFNMSGGIICNNSVNQKTGSSGGAINLRNDGAKLCISGSAYIPSSGTALDNDIYIQDKDDDTYPAIEISGELTPPSEYVAAGKKIAVSPAGWMRRKVILKAADDAPTGLNIEDYKNYFCFTSNGVNFSYGTDNTAIIMAPYFVASSGTDDDDTPGDSDNPYRTLKYAVGKLSGNYDETIKVKGILKGASEIPDTFSTTNCKSLTIEGASNLDSDGNPQDVLTIADDAASGSVLKINTEVPVTLKNIKITGGKGTPDSDNEVNTFGGGIYFEKGSLTLADGVLITGNSATVSGGGIYMPLRDAKLFMCGTSYVGDKRTTTATGTTVNDAGTNCANFAANSGGGIYSCGKVYLGYIQNSSGNIVPESWTGGICGNAASKGAGITSGRDTAGSTPESGLLKVMTGKISYNYAGSGSGGGIYAYDGTVVEFYNGEIDDNSAENGGAIYADGAATKISVSGGKLSQNTASSCGGAINYNNGTIEVSGSVYIPCTGEKQNDVYLAENKFLTIAGNLTLPEDAPSNDKNMAITPSAWTRGNQVLGASSAGLIESNKDRFATIDEDFIINQKSGELTKGVLAAPIYVASDGVYDDTRYGNKGSSSGARGTREKPYSSLETALSEVDASNYTIYIDGTFTGKTEISSTTLPNTDMLTLRGYKPEGQTVAKATLNGNFSSFGDGNTTLIINDAKKVDIYDLTIKGGNNKSDNYGTDATPGGGILITGSAEVTLGSGATITENTACYGGGVSVFNGKLTVNDGAVISKNTAKKNNSSGGYGGGIYVGKNGSLSLAGGMIGDSTLTVNGNNAMRGGGIYADYNGEAPDVMRLEMTGGSVSHNLREVDGTYKEAGAGLYICGKARISGGVIDHNTTAGNSPKGGGIYLDSNSICTISGDVEISNNEAYYGAGIYSYTDKLTVEGGIFRNNNAEVAGGAILADKVLYLKGNPVFYKSGDVIEKHKNDINLYQYTASIRITGPVTTSDEYVAAVTPHDFKRGERLLSASGDEDISNMDEALLKFVLTEDNDGWNREKIEPSWDSSMRLYIINSPIYVVGTGHNSFFQDPPESGATGTKNMPYASIFAAEEAMDDNSMDYEVIVDGSITGPQKFSYSDYTSLRAKSVIIKGYKPNASYPVTAKLNGNSTGSALTIDAETAEFPVTIQDLTITGGSATNGGGINITKGTVKLTDGAKITGNTATSNGGGVYVSSNGTLFMYGKVLVGDSATSTTRASSSGASYYANKATNGAGIYNNGGAVYIGCDTSGQSASGYTLVNNATDGYYGVRRNYSVSDGAGIYHAAGTLKIASGDISYNFANTNGTSCGGAALLAAGATVSGGTFTGNKAANGGAFYIKSGKELTINGAASITSNEAILTGGAISNDGILTMSAGTIGSADGLNSVTSNFGGAIYQNGKFTISGSAVVYAGTGVGEKINDVYLRSAYVTVGTISSTSEAVAAITPESWKRGTSILSSTSVLSDEVKACFHLSKDNLGWERKDKSGTGTDTNKYVYITSPIYVVGASGTNSTKPTGFEYGKTTGANGTKTSPYASVADALTCADLATVKEITIAGTLVGAQQEISSPGVDITLKGYKAAGAATSDAKIQRFSTRYTTNQTNGSALKVDASGKNVTITDLTITYGAALSGAGIYITAGTVKLGDYAKINDNYAANSGGGVYVNPDATLFMYGKALIGDKLSTDAGITVAGTSGFDDYANRAQQTGGGGIYNWGAAYIGYSGFDTDGTTLIESSIDNGYGIIRNYNANTGGGAIYNAGTLKIGSGSISYNNGNTGGAIKCTADATISGGTFTANKALSGGAIYVDASKTVTIDGSATFTKNEASSSGGGAIYNAGTLTMTAGTIGASGALNEAGTSGGAIYQNGTFKISGSAQVYSGTGVGEKQNDVYLASGKTVTAGVFETGGNSSSIPMVITPYSWTRGSTAVTAATGVTLDATKLKCFKMSDEDWSVVLHSSAGKINAPVYVASDTSTAGFKVCTGLGSDTDGNGSRAKPYKTIAKALSKAWDTSTTKTIPLVIKIDGTVKGNQTIAGNINAQYVAINGCYSSTDFTDCVLDGNASGTVLTITTATPVCLDYKLKITNGSNADGNGGGVSISGTSSTVVVRGVRIQGNTAKNGGGLYVGPGCKAICNNYGRIGAYLENINNKAPGLSTALSTGINKATNYGGGIYNEGTLYLGYSYNYSTGAIEDPWDDDPFSVDGNYATAQGGGVYTVGNMNMIEDNTSISYNGSSHGGGVCVATTGEDKAFFDSGIIESNSVGGNGGGIYIKTGAKAEIEADSSRPFIVRNNSGQTGGGLSIGGNLTATGSYFYVYGNSATTVGGGGAYVNGVFDFHEGVIGRDENGNVKSNTKTIGKGSGVYVASSASQFIMDTDCCVDVNNDIYLPASARICIFDHFTQFKSNPTPGIITRPNYTTDTEIFAMGPDFDDIDIGWQGCENFQVTDSNYEIKMVSGTYNITHK